MTRLENNYVDNEDNMDEEQDDDDILRIKKLLKHKLLEK